ncbi:MAG TPA: hypothetical protein PLL48_09580 [Novosphingobium sp.]|nr:hypothetical protein [Novosphingobium sp.]
MLEPASEGSTMPRAALRVGGLSIGRQQLGLVLALECERVVCIAAGVTPAIIDLQHAAEAAGAQFHVVSSARALVGLVTAGDELIALGDGLFTSAQPAIDLLSQGQAVLVQPIEQGLAAGFERIDINHASAGGLRIPGRLVEPLGELPPDCDAMSALQRIALQAGVRQRAIPPLADGKLFWTMVRSEDEAHALEPLWIRQRTSEDGPLGPARMLGRVAVRGFGPALLHSGSGGRVVAAAAAISALIALVAGWFGLAVLGLAICALGWVLREAAALLARVEAEHAPIRRGVDSHAAYGWLLDGVMVLLMGWGMQTHAALPFWDRYFPPLMLVGLLRILPRALGERWRAWSEDRALLAIALAAALLSGFGSLAVHAGAVLVLFACIVIPRGEKRLTRP